MHLGLIGYGSIAHSLMQTLPSAIDHITVLVRPTAKLKRGETKISVLTDLDSFLDAKPDIVIECAGHSAVAAYVPSILKSGIPVIVASVGALANDDLRNELDGAARTGKTRHILPCGAIGGLDMLKAHSLNGDVTVTYRGTKPPMAWAGSAAENVVDLANMTTAATFFDGTGREAALTYPKNANVVAALALAGAGFDTLKVTLSADPEAIGNLHAYTVTSPLGRYEMTVQAAPSSGNAKTSQSTIYSLLSELLDEIARQKQEMPNA